MEDEQEAELRNPFPSPPSTYVNYTTHNLKLLSLFRERSEGQIASEVLQNAILSDQTDVPEWSLTSLEKPRVDWIREEGYYNVFGDTWFLKETFPSLGEVGGHQLYPEDPAADRRPALLSILKSMLVTYSSFLEWERQVEWITTLAQNVMAAANDLRPVQRLEPSMSSCIASLKTDLNDARRKCDSLEAQLAQLREMAKQKSGQQLEQSAHEACAPITETAQFPLLPVDDVARWAEEL
ncbi:hypothetical protein BJV78DRAFT_1159877 [Lactifluus subvellereus]|nr:hypothetical protein BJV78DRAFT_1159877 [Lactifluus subvellereus]